MRQWPSAHTDVKAASMSANLAFVFILVVPGGSQLRLRLAWVQLELSRSSHGRGHPALHHGHGRHHGLGHRRGRDRDRHRHVRDHLPPKAIRARSQSWARRDWVRAFGARGDVLCLPSLTEIVRPCSM